MTKRLQPDHVVGMETLASPVSAKETLRKDILARRDALSAAERARAAALIAGRPLPVALPAGAIVSGFMPIRSEISPLPLLRRLSEAGARLALPAIDKRGRPLIMRAWTPGDLLDRGQWGIREPSPSNPTVAPSFMIVPLAAFDRRGYRLGYGAGYYDRTINALRADAPVVAIGVAYAMQEVEAVPIEPHDARLDFIMTDCETIDCRGA